MPRALHDLLVIGAGMMGSAAARHAAEGGASVALIGPDAPSDPQTHDAAFGSHHDSGRITRRLDPDPVWAQLADRSIRRYEDIAARSGIAFHRRCGVLMLGPGRDDGRPFGALIPDSRATAARMGLPIDDLTAPEAAARFAMFRIDPAHQALFESDDAGTIDPSALVRAQKHLAERAGALRVAQDVVALEEGSDSVTARCAEGQVLRGRRALVATGAYGNLCGLLPGAAPIQVYARTVTLCEIAPNQAEALRAMPTMIFAPQTRDSEPYLLPPLPYPDGKLWLKMGGEPVDHPLTTRAEATAWFRSGGRPEASAYQLQMLRDLMPELTYGATRTLACAYAKSARQRPILQAQSARITALLGGNGMAAKSSDELGRLGAELALTGAISDADLDAFQP